ncbi:hypothetical protein ACU8KH_03494 [Lachancea thermotolerans]
MKFLSTFVLTISADGGYWKLTVDKHLMNGVRSRKLEVKGRSSDSSLAAATLRDIRVSECSKLQLGIPPLPRFGILLEYNAGGRSAASAVSRNTLCKLVPGTPAKLTIAKIPS